MPAGSSRSCPHVYGLTPIAAWMVERRIREVAAMVGAPLQRNDPCGPNIGIIFTAQPQASLESIAAVRSFLVQGGNQKLTVKYPVQAWYTSLKTDFNGVKTLDVPFDVSNPASDCIGSISPSNTGNSMGDIMGGTASGGFGNCEMHWVAANDSRLHTGLTAEMATTTVLVDTNVVTGMTLAELGDYLAFMTLAQASQYGACEKLPTIANLMLKDCGDEDTPHSLSHVDIALLTALYQVPDSPEVLQKQRIVGAMRRSLEAQFGKD
jgi:hypothetical protein